jgi:protein-tyrosine kinase
MSRIHDALKKAELEKASILLERHLEGSPEAGGAAPSPEASRGTTLAVLSPAAAVPPPPQSTPDAFAHEESWAKFSKHRWKPDLNQIVFGNSDPFLPGMEQFRTLRSRLYRIRESQPLQTLLISSAIPGEGKTLIAANLAQAFVRQHGCRVLLIDADLRAPRLDTLLGAPPTPGLTDYLRQNEATVFDVIQRGDEGELCFIPGGNRATNPSELIASGRMKELLERIKPWFDWIIIDSPPALPVADASILAGISDGVLLVVRGGLTPSEVARKAVREFAGTHVIGVVLNSVKETAEYASYYSIRYTNQPGGVASASPR